MKAHFTATCSKQYLPAIREFMRKNLANLPIREGLRHQIVLAVDEACANNIIHQHNNDGVSCFDITLYTNGNLLHIEIHDKGNPFPINEYQPKDLDILIKNRIRGGLGIALINKIMDEVEVVRDGERFTYRFTKVIQGLA
jgi:serine/threonine-protein kinase RsbW